MVQYEIKITGHVQGVGFRYFSHKKANELGIKGWVRNSTDGSVVIVAQGNEFDINTFIDFLKIGPRLSNVSHISKVKMKGLGNFSSFNVKY